MSRRKPFWAHATLSRVAINKAAGTCQTVEEAKAFIWGYTCYLQNRNHRLSTVEALILVKNALRVALGYHHAIPGYWGYQQGNQALYDCFHEAGQEFGLSL